MLHVVYYDLAISFAPCHICAKIVFSSVTNNNLDGGSTSFGSLATTEHQIERSLSRASMH